MRSLRRPLRWLPGWLAVLMLFMQLSLAAYACPAVVQAGPGAEGRAEAASQAAMTAMADMPGCDGSMPDAMDPDQPQLCQAHCQPEVRSVQTISPVTAPDAPAAPLWWALPDRHAALAQPSCSACREQALSPGASPPGAPPHYLSLLVLRH